MGRPTGFTFTMPTATASSRCKEPPGKVWEDDIDAPLNYAVSLPPEGREVLADREEGFPAFGEKKHQPA
jgi:hypothetical protein